MPTGTPYNEQQLIARMSNGDMRAFEQIYLHYFDLLFLQTQQITKDNGIAEDIVQEVFLQLWERRESFAHYKKISGWLFVCCYNGSLNYLRKSAREKKRIAVIDRLTDWVNENDIQLQEQQFQLIEAAIEQLPPQRRKVFQLCKFQGMSYEQAAETLAISKNTVKEHLVKAMAFIHNYVQQSSGKPLTIAAFMVLQQWAIKDF